jgi:hypothetical protein
MVDRQRFTPDDEFYTVPTPPRLRVDVPQVVIDRIYDAAYKGVKGDRLAHACGFTPEELQFLKGANEFVMRAILKGIADNEMDMGEVLINNARSGDTKAAITMLTHRHDWMPARPVDDGNQQLTITVINALPEPATTQEEPTGGVISLTDAN